MALQAASYQAAFDYDNAVKTYLALYDTTRKAKRLGIKAPEPLPGEKAQTLDEIGLTALYNAAFAAELNRDFRKGRAPPIPAAARPPQGRSCAVVGLRSTASRAISTS
jgi:hypothetical protein